MVTFPPTCYEPAEIVEVQEGHAARGCMEDKWTLKYGPCVGQQQSKDDGHPHHYHVDGNVGLYWTLVQMFSPYVGVQSRIKSYYLHELQKEMNDQTEKSLKITVLKTYPSQCLLS